MFRFFAELKNYEQKTKLTDSSQSVFNEAYTGFCSDTAYSLLYK